MRPASRTIDRAFGIKFGVLRTKKPENFQALTRFKPVHLNTSLGLLPSRCFLAQLVTACILSLGGTGSNAIEARNFLVFLKKDCNVYSESIASNCVKTLRKLCTLICILLTSLLKSAGIRQSTPNSTRAPNCTPVTGIGAPTLYVNLPIEIKECCS